MTTRAPVTVFVPGDAGAVAMGADRGVLLVYEGKYPAAIRYFLSIERRYPGRAGWTRRSSPNP